MKTATDSKGQKYMRGKKGKETGIIKRLDVKLRGRRH